MLSQNPLVHIDEDEFLQELEALTAAPEEEEVVKVNESHVISDGVINIDGDIIELPSVPESKPSSSTIRQSQEKELIAE